jgi:hypothetical protein
LPVHTRVVPNGLPQFKPRLITVYPNQNPDGISVETFQTHWAY